MDAGKRYLVGVYDDDDVVLKAVKEVRAKGIQIEEVFTPFPIHHMEDALGYKRSRLPIIAFLFGLTGLTLALTMQISMMVIDWPLIIGGKPFFAFVDFVPVSFELMVLLAAFGMCGTFFVRSSLYPFKTPRVFDVRSTDDKHIMAIDLDVNKLSQSEIAEILKASGAVEVNEKNFEE